jgi:hypothetical protein
MSVWRALYGRWQGRGGAPGASSGRMCLQPHQSRHPGPCGCRGTRLPGACCHAVTLCCWAAGVEIAQLVAGEAAAVVHAARTWTPADLAQAPAGNVARAPMLEALLPDGRARFVGGALSPRLDAVRCLTLP